MDKKLLGLMGVFFLFFAIFAVSVALPPGSFTKFTQASVETKPSGETTRVLAWPLFNIKSDGKTESTITVIVRNAHTKPLEGRLVTVSTSLGSFRETTIPTNKEGIAIFHLVSDMSGTANIDVIIDNSIPATQKVSVQFVE